MVSAFRDWVDKIISAVLKDGKVCMMGDTALNRILCTMYVHCVEGCCIQLRTQKPLT